MAAKLILTDGGTKKAFKLKGGSARIGSGAGCPVQISDSAASSEHCVLERIDAGWQLRDLQSESGTRVNGSLIDQKMLKAGDVITIGNAQITFDLEDEVEEVVIGDAATPAAAAPAAPAPASRRSAAGAAGKRSGARGRARVAAARRERDYDDDEDGRYGHSSRKQGLSTPAIVGIVISGVSAVVLLLFIFLNKQTTTEDAKLFSEILTARNNGNGERVIELGKEYLAEYPRSPSRSKVESYIQEFEAGADPNQSQAIQYRFTSWFNNLKKQFDNAAYQKDYPDAVQSVIIQAEYFLQDAPKNHEHYNAVQVMLDRAREKWSQIEERYQFTPQDRKELGTVDYLMRRGYYRACMPMLERFIEAGDEEDKRDGKILVNDYTRYQKEDFDKAMTIAENRIKQGELVQALVKLRFVEALFTEEYAAKVRPRIAEIEARHRAEKGSSE